MSSYQNYLAAVENARKAMLAALVANDSNGVYSDSDCKAEGYEPFTVLDALEQFKLMVENDSALMEGSDVASS